MKKAQFALILLASILSCVLAASALFRDFNATTLATAVGLERYTQTCASLICDLALHGRLYLEQDARMDADLFASLREDKAAGTYSLDALLGTERAQHVGNLTGIGTLPASGPLRRELNLALQYNTFFEMYHRDHPEIVWLYYTSQNRFISAYPFTPSREFSYSDELRGVAFYDVAIPANNPTRSQVWTPCYLDTTGQGLMVTLSEPVYEHDTFRGVVSIDLTNALLSSLVANRFDGYLYDQSHAILAVSGGRRAVSTSESSIRTIGDALGLDTDDMARLDASPDRKVRFFHGALVQRADIGGTPWSLVQILPLWLIAVRTLATVLPVLLISSLAFLLASQMERRMRSETLLQKEKNLLETTLFAISEGIVITDSEGRILMMNPFAERHTGHRLADALGHAFSSIFDCFSIMTREPCADPVKAVLETGASVTFEKYTALRATDGTVIHILGSAERIGPAEGPASGVVVTFRDMTKEFEQEREIEGFLNVNLEMLCVADMDGNIHKVNRRFSEVLGYNREELGGHSLLEFIHPDDLADTTRFVREHQHDEDTPHFTNRYRCKDGSYKYIEWYLQTTFDKYLYSSARDVTEKMEREAALRTVASMDPLTGVLNRYHLDLAMPELLLRSDAEGVPLSMILLDLDHFKTINDTLGHIAGDEVLRQTAHAVGQLVRRSDLLVRFGGEEFVVILEDTPVEDAAAVAEKIRIHLEMQSFAHASRVTASFGVAQHRYGESFEAWCGRVDEAMYEAKHTGRNKVVMAPEVD